MQVAVFMGSASDKTIMQNCFDTLNLLGIEFVAHIMSAHRMPTELVARLQELEQSDCKVIIAAAGMAAHLAGVVAAHSICPVIGVPLPGGLQDGVDALFSTVQMPAGVPVATVAVGKAGAKNAAVLAAQILAVQDENLHAKLVAMREETKQKLHADNAQLQTELNS